MLVLVASLVLPARTWALELAAWIRGQGAAGVAVYVVAYIAGTLLLLPGGVLTLAAGFAYGPLWGALIVWPVSNLAATLAFVIGRFFARDWVERKAARHPRFAALDRAVGEKGFRLVLLLRLSPLFPFNLLNYALGVTRLRLSDYVLASLIGMLPGTLLYVYLGSSVTSASRLASGHHGGLAQSIVYWCGLGATIAVTLFLARLARRELKRELSDDSRGRGPE